MNFVLICLVLAYPLLASNGTQIGLVGARATALGSNFRGLADDWSAVFYNPAGLTQIENKWTFATSVGLVMPTAEHTPSPYPLDLESIPPSFPFSGIDQSLRTAKEQQFYIPSVAAFYRHSESLLFGLGVFVPFGLGTEWDLITLPDSYGNQLDNKMEHRSDHQVICIQPTAAYQMNDKLSVGLGLSLIWGSMTLNNAKMPFNPANLRWPDMQERADLLGLGLTDLTMDQRRIAVENVLEGSGFAFGANLGLFYQIHEKVGLGLSARFYSDLKLKGSFNQIMNAYADGPKVHTLNEIPAEFYVDHEDPTGEINKQSLMALFSGKDLDIENIKEVEACLPLPMTLGFGVAYNPWRRWTFTTDVSWTRWSSWDEVDIEYDEEEITTLLLDWEDTIQAGLGIDCLAWDADNHDLFIRLGYYMTDKTPIKDATMTPTIPDPVRRQTVTGGLGFNIGRLAFDLAGEYVMFEDKNVTNYVFDEDTGASLNYAGLYTANAIVVGFGVSYSIPWWY